MPLVLLLVQVLLFKAEPLSPCALGLRCRSARKIDDGALLVFPECTLEQSGAGAPMTRMPIIIMCAPTSITSAIMIICDIHICVRRVRESSARAELQIIVHRVS